LIDLSGTKTAHAATSIILNSGFWTLDNALIGTSSSDIKNGSKLVRISSTGTLGMNLNVATGASTVNVKYAVYGSDGSSTFQLWLSSNSGSNYTQIGSKIMVSSTTLNTATFNVNQSGTLHFQLCKINGGSNRINTDDFTVNSYDNGSTGSNATGGSTGDNRNLLTGNLIGAVASVSYPTNYQIDQTYFVVTAGNEVYVVTGSYGTGSNGYTTTVDNGRVTVTSNVWKVIVVLSNGNNDLSRVNSSTRVIAVNTPNTNRINTDWITYRCTVRSIKSATGYNLLLALPQSVQDVVETKVDNL
jgi:hypothetical protein